MKLFEWQNIIFMFASAGAILVFVVSAFFGLEHEMGGADADADVDVDADVDSDVGIGHDGIEHVHDFEHGEHDSGIIKALSILGVGKVPMSIVLALLMLSFGALGLTANIIFAAMKIPPNVYFIFSFSGATVLSLLITAKTTSLFAKFAPPIETVVTSPYDVVGRTGTSVYKINDQHGTVHAYDARGDLRRVKARTAPGKTIEANREVILEEYDREDDCYIVSESDLGSPKL
jgi:membrane protein implicated in regulation of membrane protease activity